MALTKTKKEPKTKNKKKVIPRTVQQTLGYIEAYPQNGVIQIETGVFSKTYSFADISFRNLSDDVQNEVYQKYNNFLNTLSDSEDIYFSIVNLKGDKKTGVEAVCPELKGDALDKYRKEMSDMIKNKFETSRNNIVTKKYLTVVIKEKEVDKAMFRIKEIGSNIEKNFKRITNEPLRDVSLAERLEVMNNILRGETNYWFEHDMNGRVSCDFEEMKKQGLTTKDIIAPEILKFKNNHFICGADRYGQTLYLDKIANWMNTNFLSDISEVNFESVVTIHISAIPQNESVKFIHNQAVLISSEVMQKQKHLMEKGFSASMIPATLKQAETQIEDLQDDILNRDQKLFYSSILITHFAENEDVLMGNSKVLKDIGAKYMSNINPLVMQQERGLKSSILLGRDDTFEKKLLTTESLAIFIPFNEANTMERGGYYYGVNAVNKSVIVHNRLRGDNYNGLILGTPGSGKSFSAKREMTSSILTSNADIYIIDPDGEYSKIAEAFGGTVIKLATGGENFINPFDLDIDKTFDTTSDPMAQKVDFICGMIETMRHNVSLSSTQRSIVDRCIKKIYKDYIERLSIADPDPITGKKPTINREFAPTLQNLYSELLNQNHPEAENLAIDIEMFAVGSLDLFSHRTNINLDSRIIVYNIKDIGEQLMELGLKVCLNDIWNKMMENRRKNKWTYFYIDEFHYLLGNDSTSKFLKNIWKRARKWQGVPTGITQNVEDLLNSSEARAIINTTSFVYMLNQSLMDRNMLQDLLHLSDNDMEYVTNADRGHGLIKSGKSVIPFEDEFPSNTELYTIMSTNPNDDL